MNYKQFILCGLLLILFIGCQPQTQYEDASLTEIETIELINKIDLHDLEILVIDKCEYIFYKKSPTTNRGFGFMAHKGNCNNPIHFYSRSMDDHK